MVTGSAWSIGRSKSSKVKSADLPYEDLPNTQFSSVFQITEFDQVDVISGRNWRVLVGDVRDGLRTLPDNSVHCCVTSPPYWGLRDYGVDGQLGLEPTPESFVASMVEVFEEVRRVLRPDGTLWLNIGDSYCSTDKWGGGGKNTGKQTIDSAGGVPSWAVRSKKEKIPGLKPKDLVGIPWRLAFALQSAGWYLRSEIIWHKPTAMPESVTDRPTKSHEQIFLLTKSPRYFFDQEAVREPSTGNAHSRGNGVNPKAKTPGPNSRIHVSRTGAAPQARQNESFSAAVAGLVETRNVRTVWSLVAESFKGAHFATFPTSIPRRCIKAGTSEKGCCPQCGAPWKRIVKKNRQATRPGTNTKVKAPSGWQMGAGSHTQIEGRYYQPETHYRDAAEVGNRDPQRHTTTVETIGWEPGCKCGHEETVPCTVLDPFSGSGTTGQVATSLDRLYIGCELNPEYAEMSRSRIDFRKPEKMPRKSKVAKELAPSRGLFE